MPTKKKIVPPSRDECLIALNAVNNAIYSQTVTVGSPRYFEIRGLCTDILNRMTPEHRGQLFPKRS